MNSASPARAIFRAMLIAGGGLFGWLLQFAGTWLVYHHSSDAGFRFVTNFAEELFFVGPALPIVLGLLVGVGLVAGLEFRRGSAHPSP